MPAYQFKNQSFKNERGKTRILKLYFFNFKLQYELSNTGMGYKYLTGYLRYQLWFEVTKVYKD